MNRSIENALNTLIPRHSSSLPPELIDLASSLLAQSRNKASSLKSEEEIGRTYACANIACERLKTTLNLPKIEPSPPCHPTTYAKLYAYLDRTLVSTGIPSRKRKREERNGNATIAQGAGKTRATPSKEKSLEGFKSHRAPKKGLRYGNKESERKLPKWTTPMVRKLCLRLEAKASTPHVLAGMESVLSKLSTENLEKDEVELQGKSPALITALLCCVMQRLVGNELTGAEFKAQRQKITDTLQALRNNREVITKVGMGGKHRRNIDVGSGLSGEGQVSRKEGEEKEVANEDEEEGIEKDLGATREEAMSYGIGTMRQPDVDWLSMPNRRRGEDFRKYMMEKIEEIIASGYLEGKEEDKEEVGVGELGNEREEEREQVIMDTTDG